MAAIINTNTNMTTQRYFDDVVFGFRDATAPMYNIFTMDASAQAAGRDQTVTAKVFVVSGSGVQTYSGTTGFVMTNSTRKGIPVSLTTYKYTSAALTQAEILESSIINLQQSARANVTELVNNIFYDHLNYVSSSGVFSAYGTTFASASSVTYSNLCDIRQTAVETYKWKGPAYLVVNSKVFTALIKDSTIADASKRGLNDVVTGNNLFRVINNPGGGWNAIYEAPDIPFTNSTIGYAVTPQALVSCMRYWAPPGSGKTYEAATPITDPNTGITLGYREWISEDYDQTNAAFTGLWGKAVVDPSGALLIKATVNA